MPEFQVRAEVFAIVEAHDEDAAAEVFRDALDASNHILDADTEILSAAPVGT